MPAEVATVSDCLAELPVFDTDPLTAPWHRSLQDAIETARNAPAGAHVLAASMPTPGADGLAEMLEAWIGDYPHPILANLGHRVAPPSGWVLGFEVLGFEAGRFHSWLCYGLHEQAEDELAVQANQDGLLTSLADAQRIADAANNKRGTLNGTPEEVTWFPVRITQHDNRPT
ncbi:hypothetical protein AB0J83_27975 [Actinoplanes sp. NPDC049596]|uniref:hypothetical protein n=1 Tax=unclassified Actinoplanes TaxID=2626549 RepID=UPI0034191A4A